jgi:hypothetical protein
VTPDTINAVFEAGGAVATLWNVVRLVRDRRVSGVSVGSTVWWTCWGGWNLFYYPALAQWWSFASGIGVVTTNAAWVGLAMYYIRKARRHGDVEKVTGPW